MFFVKKIKTEIYIFDAVFSKHIEVKMSNFEAFQLLPNNVKHTIYQMVDKPKDFLCMSTVCKNTCLTKVEFHNILNNFNKQSLTVLQKTVIAFQKESANIYSNFTTITNNLRQQHFELFMNEYNHTPLLESEEFIQEYHQVFESIVEEIQDSMNLQCVDATSIVCNPDVRDIAENLLFQFDDDEVYSDKLIIEFESNTVIIVEFTHCIMPDDATQWSDVSATCYNRNTKTEVRKKADIAFRDDASMEWVDNQMSWLEEFLASVEKMFSGTQLLGNINEIRYQSKNQQIWRKAYFNLDVLPQLL